MSEHTGHGRHAAPDTPYQTAAAAMPAWVHQSRAPLDAALRGLGQDHIGPATTLWATGQDSDAIQRAGRYVPQTAAHPQRTGPALAAHAIARYSHPGQTVFDPFMGSGTTLIEAVHAGRRAIGVDTDPRWVELTGLNLAYAHRHGATGAGLILRADARYLGPIPRRLRGRVDLVVTTPPARLQPLDGPTRSGLSNTELVRQLETDLILSISSWIPLLRPGTTIVLTTQLLHRATQTLDLTVPIAGAAHWADLDFVERVAALRTPLRDAQPRPRHAAQKRGRHRGRGGSSRPQVVHHDVLMYRVTGVLPMWWRSRR